MFEFTLGATISGLETVLEVVGRSEYAFRALSENSLYSETCGLLSSDLNVFVYCRNYGTD